MPNTNATASLDVRNFATNGDGWTNVAASNGQTYSYKYSGGSDGAGGMSTTTGQGAATLNLSLAADSRYSIQDVQFSDDSQHQLAWRGNGATHGAITDLNTQDETAYYKVIVNDSTANCTVTCDPTISNKPGTNEGMEPTLAEVTAHRPGFIRHSH